MKVPFFHNSDDYDEVIFYHAGDFFSRDNIHPGMMTFHPAGFTHGPHPKALTRMFQQTKPATDEYAVMIDTRDALDPGAAPVDAERVQIIRKAVESGTYPVLPAKVADAMIAAGLLLRSPK